MLCLEIFLLIFTSIAVGTIAYVVQKECIRDTECNWIISLLYFLVFISLLIGSYVLITSCFDKLLEI